MSRAEVSSFFALSLSVSLLSCGEETGKRDVYRDDHQSASRTSQEIALGTEDVGNLYYHVRRLIVGDDVCSATMLSCAVGITAAHCVQEALAPISDPKPFTGDVERFVNGSGWLGEVAPRGLPLTGDVMRMTQEYIPPIADYPNDKDVALFSLKSSTLKYSAYAYIASVKADSSLVGTVVGFGRDAKPDFPGLKPPVEFPRRFAEAHAKIYETFAIPSFPGGQSLQAGDSGGPLLIGDAKSHDFGIVAVAHGFKPSVSYYANVASHPKKRDWVLMAFDKLNTDYDGDGIPDACDSCPMSAKPEDHADSDNDGIPNCIDPFPCSPDRPGEKVDPDKDDIPSWCDERSTDNKGLARGFCQKHCAEHPVDNCPRVSNPNQENCNADAEEAVGAVPMGDVCDPVPCPDGNPSEWKKLSETPLGEVKPAPGKVGVIGSMVRYGLDKLHVEKINTFSALWMEENPSFRMMDTAYRYCHPVAGVFNCRDAPIDDRSLDVPASQDWDENFWHIVYAGHDIPPPSGGMDPGFEYDLSPTARDWGCQVWEVGPLPEERLLCREPAPNYDVYWNYQHDYKKWEALWGDSYKMPAVGSGSSQNGGRFWFHVDTPLGMTHASHAWELHPMIDPKKTPYGLANHYVYVTPEYDALDMVLTGIGLAVVPVGDIRGRVFPCLTCPVQDLSISRPPWAVNPKEGLLIVGVDTAEGKFAGFLSPTGTMWTDPEVFSPPVVSALSDPLLKWSSAADTNVSTGPGAGNPAMVALSADGTSVARTLSMSSRGLHVADGGLRHRDMGTPGMSIRSLTPRSGFASVYVRRLGLVLLVGGQDPTVASDEGPVVAIDVNTGERKQLPVFGYNPGNVVASTYSVRDNALWIIEEVGKKTEPVRVQIVSIGVPDGSVRVYGPWPRLMRNDKLWLTADSEGRVVLAASSSKLKQYTVRGLRDKDGTLVSDWSFRGSKETLGGAPILDLSGLRLVTGSGEIVRVEDFDQLVPGGHTGTDSAAIAEALK